MKEFGKNIGWTAVMIWAITGIVSLIRYFSM